MDDHDERLRRAVQPAGWVNPVPSGRYNLVVLGAGTAGLVAAAGAAGLGAKVALIERRRLGGDCLVVASIRNENGRRRHDMALQSGGDLTIQLQASAVQSHISAARGSGLARWA